MRKLKFIHLASVVIESFWAIIEEQSVKRCPLSVGGMSRKICFFVQCVLFAMEEGSTEGVLSENGFKGTPQVQQHTWAAVLSPCTLH